MIVILTALNLENLAVRRLLAPLRRVDHPAGTVFEVGQPPGARGLIALAVTGEGNMAAAVIAERAIGMFRPRALIFVGVAGALRDDVALGDVVVATKVYAYHGGKVQPDGFWPRPRSWEIPHQLDQVARHVHRTGAWITLLGQDQAQRIPAVHFRPIAAGEIVLNSRDDPYSELLRRTYGDAIAIEMEGAGIAQAAHLNNRLPMLSVRGISDRADGGKSEADREGWQQAAAANAAAFAMAVAADLCASAPGDAEGTTPRRSGSGSSATVTPRQLPGRPGQLVGRAAHLSWLDEVLLRSEHEEARIAILTGMAGVGKTALAMHWAHATAGSFADGQLYADCRGFGPDPPLDPQEILAIFLRALGQSETAEFGGLDERAARFRTALSGRHVLIVLDNVASVEQIRALLPGTGKSVALLTSRQRLHGLAVHHAAKVLEVDRLATEDALALLTTAVRPHETAEPGQLRILAGYCAGLPLALRIAREMMTSHPAGHLPALVDELGRSDVALDVLGTGDDPYCELRTVFSWSYRALADYAARAYRFLGLHPGNTFALPTAAALLDVPVAEAKAALRILVSAHLVTEAVAGRFGMHDLLHMYAQELCHRVDTDVDRRAATRRMFDQYLHGADRAGRLIMPLRYRVALGGAPTVEPSVDGRSGATRWFDTEFQNLVEICRISGPELDWRRWQLAYVLRDYFYLSKHLDGWLETHRLAVTGCERLGDRRAEGMTRNNLGRALLEAAQTDAAAVEYMRARDLLEEAGDVVGVTDAQVNMSTILRRRGRYAEALRDQLAALGMYRRAGLDRKVGITLRTIARTELRMGRVEAAAGHAEEALATFASAGLDLDAAQALNLLAEIYYRQADSDSAVTAGQRAIEYSRLAGSEFEEAQALHRLGAVAAQAGQPGKARELWSQALAIFTRLGAAAAETVRSDLREIAS